MQADSGAPVPNSSVETPISPRVRVLTAIRELVEKHYRENSGSPLLLSDLGEALRKQELWPLVEWQGKNLREFIQESSDPDLLIVRDKNSPAYIAVTTRASKDVVEQFISRRAQAQAIIPDLEALPRSVLLAFCVQQESGKRVFLRRSPPYRYLVETPTGEHERDFILVEDRYRRPGLKVGDVSEMTAADRLDLQTKIAAWSRDNGIQLGKFYRDWEKKNTNALERLVEAQAPEIAKKLVIPGDIALLLVQHE